jgi:hypothetical protein
LARTVPRQYQQGDDLPARTRRGQAKVHRISVAQLLMVARCFRPWPGWQQDLDGFCSPSEAPPHNRGARPSVSLPLIFDRNFVVLLRIAELIAGCQLEDKRKARETEMESSWESGVYDSRVKCREKFDRLRPLPSRGDLVVEILREWALWRRPGVPSSRTLRRYRGTFGAHIPVRAYADSQILEVLEKPCQRIILGPGAVRFGANAPGPAAAPAHKAVGSTIRCVVLDISPAYDEVPPTST